MNSAQLMRGLMLLALVVGCRAEGTPPAGPVQSPQATPTATALAVLPDVPIDELVRPGSLLICSDLPYPPQEFYDEQGNATGSDIDLGAEIARRLGLEVAVVNAAFDTIIDTLKEGQCDIVISAQNITAEREAQVDMIPYFQAGQTFVLRAGNPAGVHTQLDLCDRRVAAQSGTVQVDMVNGSGDQQGRGLSGFCREHGKAPIRLHEFEKDDEALAALRTGTVDAYFVDSPVAGYHVVREPGSFELSGLTLDVAVQGISVPRDRPALRDAVQAALRSMMDDGTYLAILASYGVEEGSVAAVASGGGGRQ